MQLFIAIAGNVGVGKSTFTRLLAKTLGGKPYFEPATENPYLADFYHDMKQWAFHSQMYFLGRRLKDHAVILADEGVLVQDRSLYENAEIFARNLFEHGYISTRDWDTYQEIYQTAVRLLRPPDLVIYLRASVPSLVDRIKKRGRDFERTIDAAYLENLNDLYENWSRDFNLAPILTIPTEDVHYLENPMEYEDVLNLIKQRLGGLPIPLPA
ncbi:deoxynucleoside kinase [Patescibacteria group bacterium]|nr:deoxynucleoside kinase [Patescibacteria group bacterium]MBU1908092.1 deoxynucleoside kinase [Patescibacteria group bacterium]